MIGVSDLLIRVQSDVTGAVSGLSGLGLGLAGLGVTAAAASAAMVKMGVDAQTNLAIVQGLTGSSQQQMAQYVTGLEKMSTTLGVTMSDAAKGLYYVVSAGFSGADALKVLNVATEAAQASGANLRDVADGLTSAMNAYGYKAADAAHVSDIMITAVTYGKQTFEEFANSIGKASATAAAYHIPLEQLAAAESSLTEKGIPANIAFTNMTYLLSHIGADAQTVGNQVTALGGHFDVTKYSSLDLVGKLLYLRDATGLNTTEFLKLIGGVRSAKEAFTLLADNGQAYYRILGLMSDASGRTAAAFQVHTQTMAFGFEKVHAALSVVSYNLVNLITPAVNAHLLDLANKILAFPGALTAMTNKVIEAWSWFSSWDIKAVALKVTLIALAGAITGAVVPALIAQAIDLGETIYLLGLYKIAWLQAAGAELLALWPFALIGAGIALVIAGIVLLITHWKQVTDFLGNVWNVVWSHASEFFIGAWNKMKTGFTDAINWLGGRKDDVVNFFTTTWNKVTTTVGNAWSTIKKAVSDGWTAVTTWLGGRKDDVVNFFAGIWKAVSDAVGGAWKTITGKVSDAWNGIKNFFAPELNWASQFFGGLWNTVSGIFRVGWEIIVKVVQDLIGKLRDSIAQEWTNIQKGAKNIWDAITNFLGGAWGTITTHVQSALTWLKQLIGNAWNNIQTIFHFYWDPISKFFGTVWDLIQKGVGIAVDWVKKRLSDAWAEVLRIFHFYWDPITKVISDAWNLITTKVGQAASWVGTHLSDLWTTVKNDVSGAWNFVTNFVGQKLNDLWHTVQDIGGKIRDALITPWNDFKGLIGSAIHDMEQNAQNHLNDAINGFKDFINGVANAINWIASHVGVSDRVPQWNPPLVHFPGLASGAQNWQGGMAWVGEAGPELMYIPKGASIFPATMSRIMAEALKGVFPGFQGGLLPGNPINETKDFFSLIGGGAKSLLQYALDKYHAGSLNLLQPLASDSKGVFNTVFNDALQKVQQLVKFFAQSSETGHPVSGPGTSDQVRGWLMQAMGLAFVSGADWLSGLGIIAHYESGGNPNAVNNWDINAKNGTPSEGLMQMIMPTFKKYAEYGRSNIWNPVDNAVAAIRYIGDRYGGIDQVPGVAAVRAGRPYVGYDTGGWINEPIAGLGLRSGQSYQFGGSGPEYVTPGRYGNAAPQPGAPPITIIVQGDLQESTAVKIKKELDWQFRLHGGLS